MTAESYPYSFEEVLLLAMEADFWLHPGNSLNLNNIRQSHRLYEQIPCLKQGSVYNNTRRQTAGGGNDFWETGVTEPEKILEDLIRILHPDLLPEQEFHYYISLQ
jgi:iron complex transport system substrate-binding protein